MLKELANLVRKDAISCIQASLEAEGQFENLKEMYNSDAKDMLEIADLIEKDKIAEAANKARMMDTAARECINDRAWDFMMDYAA
jgi:hypothetical protein